MLFFNLVNNCDIFPNGTISLGLNDNSIENPISVCSLGDASVTEGEIAEAFQMAAEATGLGDMAVQVRIDSFLHPVC